MIGFFACEVLIGFGALRAGAFIGVVACAALFVCSRTALAFP